MSPVLRRRPGAAFTILLAVIGIGACSSNGDRPEYQGAEYYRNLEVPPDLTRPDDRDALTIPKPSEEALQRFIANNKLDTFVTPRFKGVRVASFAGAYWLEVDAPVEKVWSELRKFWQQEGIAIAEERPLLGYMETKWVARKDPDAGFIRAFIQRFEPDRKDKFRVRLERVENEPKTRLYIAHRAIERRPTDDDANVWVSLPADIERERELVSRMAVYAGLNDAQREALLDAYGTYASLVSLDARDSTSLSMKGSPVFVHHRALRALDRLGLRDVAEQDDGSIRFTLDTGGDMAVEEDEIARSSWLAQLLKANDIDPAKNPRYQLKLVFAAEEDRVKITIEDAAGSREADEDGDIGGSALVEQFRDVFARALE